MSIKTYASQEYVDNAINNIKIPEGSSVELDTTLTEAGKAADAAAVGEALNNINVDGFVSYSEAQTLTDEQKAQARTNISQYEWRTFTRQNTKAPFVIAAVDSYLNNGINWSIADITMSPTIWGQKDGLTAFGDIMALVEGLYFNDEFLPDTMADLAMNLDALIAANAGDFQSGITIMRNKGGDIHKYLHLERNGEICTAALYRENIQGSFIQVRYNSSTHTIERYDDCFNLDGTLSKHTNYADAKAVGDAIKSLSDSLSTVATSGSYNDLEDKPDIPSVDGLATTDYVADQIAGAMVEVYVQDEAPSDVSGDAIWVDTSKDGLPNDTRTTTNVYVVDAATTDITKVDFSAYAIGDVILVTTS